MPTEVDLSLVAEDSLLDELKARYEAIVFCASRILSQNETTASVDYRGNITDCLGLVRVAQMDLEKDIAEGRYNIIKEEEIDGEE